MKTSVRLLRNTFFLSLAQIVNPILSMFLILVLSRKLGPEGLGIYTTVLTLFTFFSLFSALGLNSYIVREISSDRSKAEKIFLNSFYLGTISSLVFCMFMVLTAFILGYSSTLLNASIVMAAALFFATISTFTQSMLQAFEKMEYCSTILIVETVIKVIGGIGVVLAGYQIFHVICIVAISNIVSMFLGMYFVNKHLFKLKIRFEHDLLLKMIMEIPVFFMLSVVVMVYWQIDILMLSKMKGMVDVGYYAAAYRFLTIGIGLTNCYIAAIFPVISRFYVESKDNFQQSCISSIKYLSLTIIPIAVIATYLSKDIILLFYGDEFIVSARTLQILIWTLVLFPAANILGNGLVASHQQKIDLLINVLSACFNIVLNLILIPKYSHVGAGVATFLSIAFFVIIQQIFVRRVLFKMNYSKMIAKPYISGVIMALFIFIFRSKNHLFVSVIGLLIYVFSLFIIRSFSTDEKNIIRSAWKERRTLFSSDRS
jgi:O-antigen/teichoic acid export membrane protein